MSTSESSHFDDQGNARMVDISSKPAASRFARASARLRMQPTTLEMIQRGESRKGDVLGVARIAGIMAAKRTSDLIPLCHLLSLDRVEITFRAAAADTLTVTAVVQVEAKTGVEMEALTAVSVAALTVYDMCKSVDREMTIERIQLEEKQGGKSGHFQRS